MLPPTNFKSTEPTAKAALLVCVNVPPQVLVTVALANVIAPGDVGKTSVNVALVNVSAFVLVRVIRKTDVPVGLIVLGVNTFTIEGLANTLMGAFTANALLPTLVTRPPAAIVFT